MKSLGWTAVLVSACVISAAVRADETVRQTLDAKHDNQQAAAEDASSPETAGHAGSAARSGADSVDGAVESAELSQPTSIPQATIAQPRIKRTAAVVHGSTQAVPGGPAVIVSDGPDAVISDYGSQPAPVVGPHHSGGTEWVSDGVFACDSCEGCCTDPCCTSCGGLGSRLGGGAGIGSMEDCYRYGSFWEIVHSSRRFWVEPQAIFWAAKGHALPELVTTSPFGTPQGQAGVLGQPNTTVIFGNERVDDDVRNGGRINFGAWLVEGQFFGVMGDYYVLENQKTHFGIGSQGNPILARPFYNTELGIQDAAELGFVNFMDQFGQIIDLSGSVTVDTSSEVQSAGGSIRKPLWVSFETNYRVNLLAGYRFFKLDEQLRMSDSVSPMGGFFAPGTRFDSFDLFDTTNTFHGGEIGFLVEARHCRFRFEFLGRVALGNMHTDLLIDGARSVTDGVSTVVTPGGFLAQPTNMGEHVSDEFAFIPEAGARVGLQLTDNIDVSAGYNFIYVSSVLRPGGQVDQAINPEQLRGDPLTGEARPAVRLNDTDFWLQGLNAAVQARF